MQQEKIMPNSQNEKEEKAVDKKIEEANEAGELELADRIEKEAKKEVSLETESGGKNKEETVGKKRSRLQKKLDGATASYEKKRREIEAIKKELGEDVDLGESVKEEKIFKEDMEKAKAEINALENNKSGLADKQESKSEEKKEQEEKEKQPLSEEDLLKKLESMPENERKTMEVGWHNLGFAIEGAKAKMFSKIVGMASKFISKESTVGKFFEALSGTYKKDAELQERKIANAESEEGQKLLKTSNRLKLFSNVLKIASYIGHGPAMSVSSVFARGMETAKKMRLDNEEVLNKNRIADENMAAEEAWAIYEQAQKSSKEGKPSKINLQRSYEASIPKDVLERLSKSGKQNVAQSFLLKMLRKPIEFSAKRLDKKIQAVENNPKIGAEEKEARKNKLLDTYSRALNDLDGIVSQTGEMDTIAAGLKYAEVTGKGVMVAIMAKTVYDELEYIWDNIGETFSSLENEVVDKIDELGMSPKQLEKFHKFQQWREEMHAENVFSDEELKNMDMLREDKAYELFKEKAKLRLLNDFAKKYAEEGEQSIWTDDAGMNHILAENNGVKYEYVVDDNENIISEKLSGRPKGMIWSERQNEWMMNKKGTEMLEHEMRGGAGEKIEDLKSGKVSLDTDKIKRPQSRTINSGRGADFDAF